MSIQEKMVKLQKLESFILNPESEESKNHISDLLEGETERPEELFVQKFLNTEFWTEIEYNDSELKFKRTAGIRGRVEWTLKIDGKLIAIEWKRPIALPPNLITTSLVMIPYQNQMTIY